MARASGTQPDSDPAFLHKLATPSGIFLEIWRMQMCETVRALFTISVFYRLETTPHTHTPVCWTHNSEISRTRDENRLQQASGVPHWLSQHLASSGSTCAVGPRCDVTHPCTQSLIFGYSGLSAPPPRTFTADQSTGFDQALYTKLRPDCAQYWRAPSFARAWILSYMASSPSCGNESANATMARKAGSSVMTGL